MEQFRAVCLCKGFRKGPAICYWNKTDIFVQEFDAALEEIEKYIKARLVWGFLSL